MADYGAYDSGTGSVISAIQRPALNVNEEQERIRQNLQLQNQQAELQSQSAPYQQANDLINQAVASRQAIESKRNLLSRELGGTINRNRATGIASQIEGLDRAAHGVMEDAALQTRLRLGEADDRRMMAHQQAEFAERVLKTDRETEIDEQGAGLMTGLARLDPLKRQGQIGDEHYDAGLLDLAQQFGLGLRHPAAARVYDHYVTEADKRNSLNLRRTTSEVTKLAAKFGIEPQFGDDGLPSIEATKAASLQTPKGKSEAFEQMNKEMFQKYGVATGVGSLFNPVQPHKPVGKDQIEIPSLGSNGEVLKTKVPIALFNQMKADFNDRYFSITPQQAQPQAAAPAQGGGLQAGATRNVGGVNYTWDGTRWKQ